MSPILELRGSIPIALQIYHLPVWSAFLFSVVGNIVPVIFLLLFLEKISDILSRRFYPFDRFFAWLFEKTKRDHSSKFERWKEFALIILVAIPLPFTGAWTGSICAFVFGIPFKKALPLIAIGVVIAGVIVSFIATKLI